MGRHKTHSGAKKRFKILKNGGVKHKKAGVSHLLRKKGKAPKKFKYGKLLVEVEAKKIKNLIVK